MEDPTSMLKGLAFSLAFTLTFCAGTSAFTALRVMTAQDYIPRKQRRLNAFRNLVSRPIVRQYVTDGVMYREPSEREPSRYELYFESVNNLRCCLADLSLVSWYASRTPAAQADLRHSMLE